VARELETVRAKVAHEVKNPLAAIRALVEVMREARAGDPADRDHRRLAVIAGELERIEGILRDSSVTGCDRDRQDPDLGGMAQLIGRAPQILQPIVIFALTMAQLRHYCATIGGWPVRPTLRLPRA